MKFASGSVTTLGRATMRSFAPEQDEMSLVVVVLVAVVVLVLDVVAATVVLFSGT